MVGCYLIEYQLTIGSQSADTLIKALIDRLVGNPYETQDLEILSMLLCREIQKCSYKIISTEVQKRFLLITLSIYMAAG